MKQIFDSMNEKLSHIIWIEAQEVAKKIKHKTIEPIDILLAIILDKESQGSIILSQFFSQGINGVLKMGDSLLKEEISEEKNKKNYPIPSKGEEESSSKKLKKINDTEENKIKDLFHLNLSKKSKLLLEKSYKDLVKRKEAYLGTGHVLLTLIEDKIIYERLSGRIFLADWKEKLIEKFPPKTIREIEPIRGIASQFIINITSQAREKKLDPVYGREKEIKTLISYLGRKKKNNVLLLGEPGIGKTALIEGLAQRLLESFDPYLNNLSKTILSLDVAGLIAGTRYRGDFEERFKQVLKEIDKNSHNIIFIDEIHMIMGAGSGEGGNIDMANMLKPMLARSGIQFIGATTLSEYKLFIEKDKALTRRFQVMMLEEPSPEESLEILKSIAPTYQDYHGFSYEEEALQASIDLTQSLIPNRKLPDIAIDILDIAFSQKKMKEYGKINTEEIILKKEDIYETIHNSLETSPFFHENNIWKRSAKLKKLKEALLKKNPRYEEVVEDIVQRVAYQCLLKNESNSTPFLTCLLVEEKEASSKNLVKSLASLLWEGKQNHFISFDLEDYNESSSLQRLIGSPLGFADHKEGGLLTETVKNSPSTVILFENIDKAYFNISSILLKIAKEGKILDSKNQIVSFTSSLIFFSISIKNLSELLPIGFQWQEELLSSYSCYFRENLKKKINPTLIENINLIHLLKSQEEDSSLSKIKREVKSFKKSLEREDIILHYEEELLEEINKIWEKEKENFKNWQEFIYFYFKKDLTKIILDNSDSHIKSLIIKAEIVHNKVKFVIENETFN